MTRKISADTSARSPFAGCAIMIAALLVMVFLIVFSTLTLFRQFKEIAKFTSEKPQPVEETSLEGKDATLNAFAQRLEAFRQQLDGDAETELALTPDEMNLAIAAYTPFKDLRGTFRVIGVEGETLRIAIAYPINGKPRLTRGDEKGFITSDTRYLNATLIARPVLLKHEIVLRLDDIQVPRAKVPREFIEQMSPYRITERYVTDPVIGPAMAKLTHVEVSGGQLVLKRVPGEIPPDEITDEQVDKAGGRLFKGLGILASVFLVFAGAIVFIGLRAKAKQGR